MSAALTLVPGTDSTAEHVEAAIQLIRLVKAEGERRDSVLATLHGVAANINGGIDLSSYSIDMDKTVDGLQTSIVKAFVAIACERFAPTGGTLSIESEKYEDKYLPGWRRAGRRADFDPRKLWADLVADWGQGKGESVAYRQAAQAITRFFWIRRNQEVTTVRGNVVLNHSIYLDEISRKYSNKNELSYNSQRGFYEIAQHFDTFAAWCGIECFARTYREMVSQWGHSREIVSRERLTLGAHAFMVTHHKKAEFHFAPLLATQLQAFLESFGELEER